MTPHERETELSAELERELRAVDEAIAGLSVDPDLEGVAEIARELRAERPEPDEEFAERLDAQAAAGFPVGGSRFARAARRVPGATALSRRGRRASGRDASGGKSAKPSGAARGQRQGPSMALRVAGPGAVVAFVIAAIVAVSVYSGDGALFSGGGSGDDSAQVSSDGAAAEGSGGGRQTEENAVIGGGQQGAGAASLESADSADSATDAGDEGVFTPAGPAPEADSGNAEGLGFTGGGGDGKQRDRKVQRDAKLALSTAPDDVRRVADEAIEVVEDNRGIVFSSEIADNGDETSVARLNVSVPTTQLQATLAELSDLAMVESRRDSSVDITAEFRSARSRLQEFRAERESLLSRLAAAQTTQESESIRRRLRTVDRQIAGARTALNRVERRADLAPIDLTVRGDGSTSGAWTPGAAADDALDVLRFLAGVGIVSAAVVVPLLALLLIAWLIRRRVVHSQREHALEG